jgi:hypothetical protein
MESKKEENLKINHKIADDVKDFVQQLESLRQTYPLMTVVLRGAHWVWVKKYNEFIEKEAVIEEDENEEEQQLIEVNTYKRFEKLKRNAENTEFASRIIARNFLIAIVSQFDVYLGKLMRNVFKIKPEVLNSSERTLTFSKLSEYTSLEEAKEYVIEKEIESILRENHLQQIKWFENKLGNVRLTNDLPCWKDFIELTERRNLFVHTDGLISSQYLNVCISQGIDKNQLQKVGDQLEVDDKYFEKAYRTILDIGFRLSQVIWRKLLPDENGGADSSIVDVIFDLLNRKEYELAAQLSEFATHKVIKHASMDNKMICVINKAQAYKWAKNEEKCKSILKEIDWSAYSDKFKLANYVLIDDFENAAKIMKRIGSEHDEIDEEAYAEWPIFIKFRKSNFFKQQFEVIFNKPFVEIDHDKQLLAELKKMVETEKE